MLYEDIDDHFLRRLARKPKRHAEHHIRFLRPQFVGDETPIQWHRKRRNCLKSPKVLSETRLWQNRGEIPIGIAACCLHRHIGPSETHLSFLEGSVGEC